MHTIGSVDRKIEGKLFYPFSLGVFASFALEDTCTSFFDLLLLEL